MKNHIFKVGDLATTEPPDFGYAVVTEIVKIDPEPNRYGSYDVVVKALEGEWKGCEWLDKTNHLSVPSEDDMLHLKDPKEYWRVWGEKFRAKLEATRNAQ